MEKLIAENPSLKRLLVTTAGAGAIALNKKWGLNLGDVEVEALAALVIGFLAQSAYKEAAKAKGVEAAATIKTPGDAVAVLNEAAKP